jgi:sugar-specific transcriptional regulator TrmB
MNILLQEKLRKTGLKDKEALVYAYLIETGGAYPSKIATHTKINRSTVYMILDTLTIRGFVGEVEKKKKLFYYPEPAQKFLRTMKDQIHIAENLYEHAQKLVPEIEGILKLSEGKPRVTFYEGKDEVIKAYFSQIDGKGNFELLAFANTTELKKFMPWKIFRNYIETKEKKKITARGIIPNDAKDLDFIKDTHTGITPKYKPTTRYVPKEIFPFKGEIIIYQQNKVQFVKFDDVHPIAVIIEDTMIHDMMKMIFELAWIGAEKT